MSVAASQARTLLGLLQPLRRRWRTDQALPATIQKLLARDRRFGSRDRRLYRELLYTTLRYLPWIEPLLDDAPDEAVRRVAWLAAEMPATAPFRAEFAKGEPHAGDRAELLPAWFRAHCPEIFSGVELDAQLRRAPLWVRLQTDNVELAASQLDAEGMSAASSPALHSAWRLPDNSNVVQSSAYRDGLIEIQDLGSQLILAAVGLMTGDRWLDACAGAGGKSLQLAKLLGPTGLVTSHDIRSAALDELRVRASRARLGNIRITTEPAGTFDGVLVDAPCTGSGTWRRSPHLKWTTQEIQVAEAAKKQLSLLNKFAAFVQPGGRLVYATCSLSRQENEEVIRLFLAAHTDFTPAPLACTFGFTPHADGVGLTIFPARHDTDGFFVASLRRK